MNPRSEILTGKLDGKIAGAGVDSPQRMVKDVAMYIESTSSSAA